MASPNAAWGMEIGADAIKAIRLERDGDQVRVSDFAVIRHKKVLTTPDLDTDEMVRLSLGQFISQKSLEGEHLVMSVPGHAAFARFAKLPPVEPKKVPDIVKFEAVQQIPFPDRGRGVGLPDIHRPTTRRRSRSASSRSRVNACSSGSALYGELGISPESLTLSPVSVFNAMTFDLNLAERTELRSSCSTSARRRRTSSSRRQGRCWIRTFPLGGTHFTEAIASAFKLSYTKAEKLKKEPRPRASTPSRSCRRCGPCSAICSRISSGRSATTSRSTASSDLKTMIGIGSTFKIPGLRKFIGQQLQIDVVRLDEFKPDRRHGPGGGGLRRERGEHGHGVRARPSRRGAWRRSTPNLVPVKALREQMWHTKTKWFAAAAAIFVAGAATTLYHPVKDRGVLLPGDGPPEATSAMRSGKEYKQQLEVAQSGTNVGSTVSNVRRLLDYRAIWPHLVHDVSLALQSTEPQKSLLGSDVGEIRAVPATERRLVTLERLDGAYRVEPGQAGAPGSRRIAVTMDVELSYRTSDESPEKFLNRTVAEWLREHAEPKEERADVPYRILPGTVSINPTRRQDFVVRNGSVEGSGAPAGPRPPRPGYGPSRPAASPPPAPPRPSMGGASAGSMGGRRQSTGPRRKAPSLSGGAAGAGPTTPSTPSTSGRPGGLMSGRPSGASSSSDGERGQGLGNLNELAPTPERPLLYENEERYYRLPITFEIEILDARPAGAPAGVAATAPRREEVSA